MPKNQDWKEILSTRNLTVDDMYDMGIEDRGKYITKEAVWKEPDYQKLVNTGTLGRDAAYLLKQVYDAIPAKPADTDYIKNQSRWHEERKNYITFVSGVRDAMKHVRTADDMQKALQTVLIDNGFATQSRIVPEYKQCGARRVALALLKKPEQIHDEALQKMFCIPEKEQARMYFNVHCFVPGRCEFKEVKGKPVLAVADFDGERHYTVPKNSRGIDLNPESWKPNSFFLTRNGVIMHNNFETLTEAQKAVDMFGQMAVKNAKTRNATITPSHRPALYIPDVIEPTPVKEEVQPTPEEELIDAAPVVEETPIFTDDPYEEPEAPEVVSETPSIGEEIKNSLQDAINLAKSIGKQRLSQQEPSDIGHLGVDPLEQFRFRNGSLFDTLNTEEQQAVLSDVAPAFYTLQKALDLPPEGISFGGYLALTFDESPNKICASYNMQTDTLNLAQLNGNDIMAMSWFSALDLALGEQLGYMAPLSEQPYREVKEVAPQFAKLMRTACVTDFSTGSSESNYHTASRDFDMSISDKSRYWQSMPNMLSRAFACYIADKTQKRSPYLSGLSEKAGPVPQGLERLALNQQFNAVIAEAKQIGIFTAAQEHVAEQAITEEPKRTSLDSLIANAGAPTNSGKSAESKNREDR